MPPQMSPERRAAETAAVVRTLRERTNDELMVFGEHCARIGVEPGSIIANAIAMEMIRRGLVPGRPA